MIQSIIHPYIQINSWYSPRSGMPKPEPKTYGAWARRRPMVYLQPGALGWEKQNFGGWLHTFLAGLLYFTGIIFYWILLYILLLFFSSLVPWFNMDFNQRCAIPVRSGASKSQRRGKALVFTCGWKSPNSNGGFSCFSRNKSALTVGLFDNRRVSSDLFCFEWILDPGI